MSFYVYNTVEPRFLDYRLRCLVTRGQLKLETRRCDLEGRFYMEPARNWYTDKPCLGGSGTDRICYLVPNGFTSEGDPI